MQRAAFMNWLKEKQIDDEDEKGDDDYVDNDVDDNDLCKVKPADYSLDKFVLFGQ